MAQKFSTRGESAHPHFQAILGVWVELLHLNPNIFSSLALQRSNKKEFSSTDDKYSMLYSEF